MKITREQLLKFFGEDEPEDIANYMADHISYWIEKPEKVKEFVEDILILSEQDEVEEIEEDTSNVEELKLLKSHFGLKDNEVLNSDDDIDREEFAVLINGRWSAIEVCHIDSDTVKDLGIDIYYKFINNNEYVWRWL